MYVKYTGISCNYFVPFDIQLEKNGEEVDEGIYEKYLAITDEALANEKFCFRTFFIVSPRNEITR